VAPQTQSNDSSQNFSRIHPVSRFEIQIIIAMPTRRTECNPLRPSQFVTIGSSGNSNNGVHTSNNGLRLFDIVSSYDIEESSGEGGAIDSASRQPFQAILRSTCNEASGVLCMDWCLDSSSGFIDADASSSGGAKASYSIVPNVLAFGTQRGEVYLLNWNRAQQVISL
jgi:hypothetical protein